jgi:hypothetical protein
VFVAHTRRFTCVGGSVTTAGLHNKTTHCLPDCVARCFLCFFVSSLRAW